MSYTLLRRTFSINLSQLSKCECLLLLKLADLADEEGYCFPRISFLEAELPLSKRSILNAFSSLVDRGLITRIYNSRKKLTKLNLQAEDARQ